MFKWLMLMAKSKIYIKKTLNNSILVAKLFGEGIWFIFAEVLYEAIFLSFVLYLLFEHIKPLIEYTITHPGSNIWKAVESDMNANQILYSIFFMVLLVWFIIKMVRKTRDDDYKNKTITVLQAIARKLGVSEDELLTESEKRDKKYERDKKAKSKQ